jgi:hypothetical protein
LEDPRFSASSWIGGLGVGVGVGSDDEANDGIQLNRNEDLGRTFNNLLTPRNVFTGDILDSFSTRWANPCLFFIYLCLFVL